MDTSQVQPMPATIVGQRLVKPAAVAAALGVLVASSCAISTQIATRLGFSPDLGYPVLGRIYDPLGWLRWLWMAYGQIIGLAYFVASLALRSVASDARTGAAHLIGPVGSKNEDPGCPEFLCRLSLRRNQSAVGLSPALYGQLF